MRVLPVLLAGLRVDSRPMPDHGTSRAMLSIELAFPAIRTVEVSAQGSGFSAVEVEQVGNFRFVAGLSLGVM